ncbi:MAG: hypothetical protein DCC68_25585 [Planctomycetota bacterium]|nr:MAG: hypothetical protein DCC68_25585 [Planctomycetota bacterium]
MIWRTETESAQRWKGAARFAALRRVRKHGERERSNEAARPNELVIAKRSELPPTGKTFPIAPLPQNTAGPMVP